MNVMEEIFEIRSCIEILANDISQYSSWVRPTVFRGPRNSTPRRGIYVNAAEFRGAAETAPFALDCRQIVLTRVS